MSACVAVGFRAGSRWETKNTNGLSHYVEHLVFEGGPLWPSFNVISEALDEVGGEFNGGTDKNFTLYYVFVPASETELALSILTDMLVAPRFDEAKIEVERGAITREISGALDEPRAFVREIAHSAFFGDHPLGWPVAGTYENVSRFTREDLIDFFRKHYIAENTFIAVAGNVDPNAFLPLLEPFASMPQGTVAQPLLAPSHPRASDVRIVQCKTTEDAYLHLILPGPARSHPKRQALSFAVDILGVAQSSRLLRVLRGEHGLVYSIHASLTSEYDHGFIEIHAGTNTKDVALVLSLLMKELRAISQDSLGDHEFLKVQRMRAKKMELSGESSLRMATRCAGQLLRDGRPKTIEEKIKENSRVTKEETEAAARKFLNPFAATLAIVGNVRETEEELLDIIQNA